MLPLKKLKSCVRNCMLNIAVNSTTYLSWTKRESKFTEPG